MYVCFQAYGNTPTCIKLQNVKKNPTFVSLNYET